jgi:hypothetical protein
MRKHLMPVICLTLLAFGIPGLASREAAAQAGDALTLKARAFLAAMAKGDFKQAVVDFDETMLKLSGPEKLEPMWTKQLPAQVGAFKQQGPARREEFQGYQIVLITCSFEKALLRRQQSYRSEAARKALGHRAGA